MLLKENNFIKFGSLYVQGQGSGYAESPSVSITGGGGSGAQAQAIIKLYWEI
jgi:hypothetical protein